MGKLHNFISSANVRNVGKLLSANVVAQVIGLIVYPILTRMYAPEDFGLMNLFVSIGNVLVVLALADYYYAIVLPKQKKDAIALTQLCFFCLLIMVGIVACSVLFAQPISALFKSPSLTNYYWLMPIYVLIMGGWNILNYWYIRQKQFGQISTYLMSQSVLSACSKTGFGYVGMLQGGMIYSVVIAPLASQILSITLNFKKTLRPLLTISKTNIVEQGKKYRNFPYFVLPRSFLNVLAGQLPILVLTPFFGAKHVGLLSMAILLSFTPINTITRALYQVLYQHTTECVHATVSIGKMFRRFVRYCSAITIPVFAVLYFVLPDITIWLLGGEWQVVGEYIRWMLPWLYLSLLTGSTCYLSDVFMKQRTGLFFEILLAVCRVAGLCVGIATKDFTTAIAAYAIGTSVAVLAQFIWLASLVKKYDSKISTN